MTTLRLAVMNKDDFPAGFSCGVPSIDNLIKDAFAKTLFKQAKAYNIVINNTVVGSCMIRFVSIEDEEFYITDHTYTAIELVYIAVDKHIQHNGIGTKVLNLLIMNAKRIADNLPVRFLLLNALKDRKKWYIDNGFSEYPRIEDERYPDTIPMRIDFINADLAEKYAESFV